MKVEGARRLARKLAAMPKAARAEISAAIEKSADEVVTLQKSFAPKATGRLASTIRWRWGGVGIGGELRGDAELSAVITAGGRETQVEIRKGSGVPFDYAVIQEFGAKGSPPQPYFYPGYRLIKRRVRGRISRATNKAAKRVAAGGV